MDFVLSNAPARIVGMTRSVAWAILHANHALLEETSHFDNGQWHMRLQNSDADIPKDPFVYGHTGTVAATYAGNCPQAENGPKWRVAWDPRAFDAVQWSQDYGDAMWNHATVQFMTLHEALAAWPESGWHMRPCGEDSGPKAFKGFFAKKDDLRAAWLHSTGGKDKDPSMRVAVSGPRLPHQEYRLAFMRGECVDGSLYLTDGRLTLSRGAPAQVLEFATSVARNHPLPSTHCAVDVGVDASGAMGIIEFNSLHSSGLYAIDRSVLVAGIARTWAP